MTEPHDSCRPVALPSGETIRVHMGCEPTPAEVDAIGAVVNAVRTLHAAEHPANPAAEALWGRLSARKEALDVSLFAVARECGVVASTLFRIAQGYMPGDEGMAAIEAWLADA